MRRYNYDWKPLRLKSGKLSTRRGHFELYPYSVLARCDHCQRLSSADWIKPWYQRRFRPPAEPEPVLCMGCFNRFRPIWAAEAKAHEARLFANRIKREISNVRKNSNHGRFEGRSV